MLLGIGVKRLSSRVEGRSSPSWSMLTKSGRQYGEPSMEPAMASQAAFWRSLVRVATWAGVSGFGIGREAAGRGIVMSGCRYRCCRSRG